MKVTFPHIGKAYIPVRLLLESMGTQTAVPEINSAKTLEQGSRISPDEICLPFKLMAGNLTDGYKKGADTAVMVATGGAMQTRAVLPAAVGCNGRTEMQYELDCARLAGSNRQKRIYDKTESSERKQKLKRCKNNPYGAKSKKTDAQNGPAGGAVLFYGRLRQQSGGACGSQKKSF